MTKVVKGAGRARAARNKRHNEQEKRVVGGDRTDALRSAAGRSEDGKTKAPAKPKATKPAADAGVAWDDSKSPGANVDAMKNAGATWRQIGEAWNAAGAQPEVVPGADGGKLLRARKQFLAGTEGQSAAERRSPRARKAKAEEAMDARSYAEKASERTESALARRSVPWDDETPDEDIVQMLNGKRITWVSASSGEEVQARVFKDSKYNKIGYGKDGRYITFVSVDGPFLSISLSKITRVN